MKDKFLKLTASDDGIRIQVDGYNPAEVLSIICRSWLLYVSNKTKLDRLEFDSWKSELDNFWVNQWNRIHDWKMMKYFIEEENENA